MTTQPMQRIETLIQQIEACPDPAVWAQTQELIQPGVRGEGRLRFALAGTDTHAAWGRRRERET